jgi:hypothetical protein
MSSLGSVEWNSYHLLLVPVWGPLLRSEFSFRLVPEAMHDIPDYVTVLDEAHAITSPYHFIYRR